MGLRENKGLDQLSSDLQGPERVQSINQDLTTEQIVAAR